METFLLKGSKFNLNVLRSGSEKETIKALLKPFKPGENRFGEMDVTISEANGCAVVTQVGPASYCLPRHRHAFEPSFLLELNGIL